MFSNNPAYNRIIRKYVVAFGNLFNNITMVRYKQDGTTEVDRIKVPLAYGPKEKYTSKLLQDPDLNRNIQTNLPRISFELLGWTYDPMRKQMTNMKRKVMTSSGSMRTRYVDTPYDFQFEVSILVRNIEEGNQIIEQIMPIFSPSYSVSINLSSDFPNEFRTIPITLNSVNHSVDYEGNYESTRSVVYTLSFTLKGWFFASSATQNIIRTVITNVYDASTKISGLHDQLSMNMTQTGNTVFKYGDIVYQGPNQIDATAVGTVIDWIGHPIYRLTMNQLGGSFKLNVDTWAASTNASYIPISFYVPDTKIITITIVPDPIDALPNSDYGYTTTIAEYY